MAALALGTIATFGGLLVFEWDTLRYLHDVIPAGSLIGVLGLFSIVKNAAPSTLVRGLRAVLAVALVTVGWVAACLIALPELDVGNRDAYMNLAYIVDRAESQMIKAAFPGDWPGAYLDPLVRQRIGGIFYPADAAIPFDSSADRTEYGFTIYSLCAGAD